VETVRRETQNSYQKSAHIRMTSRLKAVYCWLWSGQPLEDRSANAQTL